MVVKNKLEKIVSRQIIQIKQNYIVQVTNSYRF